QIYEGANGIQALDLVGRKLPMHTGRLLRRFFHPLAAFLEENQADPRMAEFVAPLAKAFGRLQRATAWIARQGLGDPEEAGAASSDYLRLFALVALGYMWARMVKVSVAKLDGEQPAFYRSKVATARFFMARLLPETSALFAAIMAGKNPVMALNAEAF
ncbi:MAG: acyl-CoA dehydrogenase, partial [Alphaproteobacteria bacterium]